MCCTVFVNGYFNDPHCTYIFFGFSRIPAGDGKIAILFFTVSFQAPASTFPLNVNNYEIHISNYSPPNLSS
jgi:hypothetical protein